MTEHKYQTELFDREHRHFGGVVYLSDFNTEYRKSLACHGSPTALRIASDFHREKSLCDTYLKGGNAHA